MITVIADDITGAAEIAGIALKSGCRTMLTTSFTMPDILPDVIVLATDTRSMSEDEAYKTIMEATAAINRTEENILFKKTDSVLRGHVTLELNAIIDCLKYDNAILLPQNPSKKRIVKNGIYLIDGQRLDETEFSRDPEFPAHTADVIRLLENKATLLKTDDKLYTGHNKIFIADASTNNDIKTQLAKITPNTLPAGGADFFTSLLNVNYGIIPQPQQTETLRHTGKTVIICGSTQSKDIGNEPFIKQADTADIVMPDDVFEGRPADLWIEETIKTYTANDSIIIRIGNKRNGGKNSAVRLRGIMAEITAAVVNTETPALLVIEGGATAYSILNKLDWTVFSLKKEYAPGVVSMIYNRTEIILKPGSYPWGGIFGQQ